MATTRVTGNRIKLLTAAAQSGTGTFNLDTSGETNFNHPSAASDIASGDTVGYCIVGATDGEWEVGRGVVTTGTPWTISRPSANVEDSSNSDALVNFTSGQHTVILGIPTADDINAAYLPMVAEQTADSNPTFTWNRTMPIDISAYTADRTLTVTTPKVGDRARIIITTGDDSYELLISGDTGISVGGATAGTEWSRLFITAECIELFAVSATEVAVVVDGRIPQSGRMFLGTSTTGTPWTDAGWTEVQYDTEDYDNANIGDTTNERFNLRRTGKYVVSAQVHTTTSIGATALVGLRVDDDQASPATWFRSTQIVLNATNGIGGLSCSSMINVTDLSTSGAASVRALAYQNSDANADYFGDSNGEYTYLAVEEIF